MTNTINNVPRELLADLLGNDHDKRIMAERHLLAMLANAPTPAPIPDDGEEISSVIELVHGLIGGKTVSVDISTGEDDAGNRVFATVYEVQEDVEGFVILCDDPHWNYPNVSALHAQRIGELEGLLRHAQKQVPTGSGLHMRIDAALSAGKEGE